MIKIFFVFLILCCLTGCYCSNPKYCVTTETRTSYFPYAQQTIERVDFSVQFKKEW
jgi:hypothetical protein